VEELCEFRLDLEETIPQKTEKSEHSDEPFQSVEEMSQLFYQELEKAEILVDLDEKFLKRHFACSRNNKENNVADFLQEMMDDKRIQKSLLKTKAEGKSNGYQDYLPTKIPILDVNL
jgi:hypothetical protein